MLQVMDVLMLKTVWVLYMKKLVIWNKLKHGEPTMLLCRKLLFIVVIIINFPPFISCRFVQASDEGSAVGAYHLGNLYSKGKIYGNKADAFNYLQKAAIAGQTDAYNGLGMCYEKGMGVAANSVLALENYRISAKHGSKIGMYNLGYLLVQNAIVMRSDLHRLRPPAFPASAVAADTPKHLLSVEMVTQEDEEYYLQRELLESTLREGIHWLRAASENRMMDAAFQLGRLYEQVKLHRDA
jgi:TPR repeat protein